MKENTHHLYVIISTSFFFFPNPPFFFYKPIMVVPINLYIQKETRHTIACIDAYLWYGRSKK